MRATPYECEEGLRRKATDPESPWRVAENTIGDFWISTIFLGIAHNMSWSKEERPIVFETMIHNDKKDEWLSYQERYCTWDEALAGHNKAVEWVNNGCKEDEL